MLLVKFRLLTKHVFTRQEGKGLGKACLVHTGTSRGVYTERCRDDVDGGRTAHERASAQHAARHSPRCLNRGASSCPGQTPALLKRVVLVCLARSSLSPSGNRTSPVGQSMPSGWGTPSRPLQGPSVLSGLNRAAGKEADHVHLGAGATLVTRESLHTIKIG